jgi:hypothetical protein
MWKLIPVPKAVALIAFLLPWMTVSCDGQVLMEANGFQLATGSVEMMGQAATSGSEQTMNIWLILACVAIVIGIVIALVKDASAATLALGTSVVAIVMVIAGRFSAEGNVTSGAEGSGTGDDSMGIDPGAIAEALQIEWKIGFYVTLVALIAAAVMSFMVMQKNKSG